MGVMVKVHKKGIIVLPKALRELEGIEVGDMVTLEGGDGIRIIPRKKVDREKLMAALEEHRQKLVAMAIKGAKLGELADIYGEIEFEDEDPDRR